MKTSTVIVVGLVVAGGVGFYLYRKRQQEAAAATGASNGTTGRVSDLLKGWSAPSSGAGSDPASVTQPAAFNYSSYGIGRAI